MEHSIEVAGLSDDLINRLDEQASRIGVDRSSYVRRLIERAVTPPDSASSIADILADVHDYTVTHGIADEELERFFKDQLSESRRERRRQRGRRTG